MSPRASAAPEEITAPDGAATPTHIDLDPRVLDARRTLAHASALVETARARRQGLRRGGRGERGDARDLARLEAERDLPQARIDERAAEIEALQDGEALAAVRAAVRAEASAVLTPLIREAVDALVQRLQDVEREEHAALLRILQTWTDTMGSGHANAQHLVLPFFASGGSTPPDPARDVGAVLGD